MIEKKDKTLITKSYNVDADVIEALERCAIERDESMSQLVRRALIQELKRLQGAGA